MILVTGGTGFVGPKIVNRLRADGRDVRCLVRDRSRGREVAGWGAGLVEGDVTDRASLDAAVAGCDVVIHLVAILVGRREDFERVMEQATRDLVDAAGAAGVRRFILMSALGTSDEARDLVPYYHAKWEMERAVRESVIEHVIFRPSFVFGRDGGALQQFTRLARLSPVTPIVGSGKQRLQPIWVDDVAAYFAAAVDAPAAANRTFELGGPDVVTWNELWDRLKRSRGLRRPSVHIPNSVLRLQATVLERLPKPPVTRDQLTMLEAGDNVVADASAVETFKLPLVPLDEQLRRAAASS
jgi:NADH dehydrogenase